MDDLESPPTTSVHRRPSLYAAVRLAGMVQQVRRRLRERLLCRAENDGLRLANTLFQQPPSCESPRRPSLRSELSSPLHLDTYLPARAQRSDAGNFTGLLQAVEERVSSPISRMAAQDRLFLQQEHPELITKTINEAGHILDVSTLLIARLEHARTEQLWAQAGIKPQDRISCEKYLANLEHLLRCFQQAAFEVLVQQSLRHLQRDYHYWEQYLEQRRKVDGDCISEWEGGQPPLNSTMPWNIKPSLVVLWGVCWMFYDSINNQMSPEQARLRRESEAAWHQQQQWSQNYAAYQDQSPIRRQSVSTRHSLSTPSGVPPPGSALGVGLGLHVTDATSATRASVADANMSHRLFPHSEHSHPSTLMQQPPQATGPTYLAQGGSHPVTQQAKNLPYISTTNITPASSTESSLAVSSPSWPHEQGAGPGYSTTHNAWGPSPINVPTTASFAYPATPVSSHVSQFDIPATAGAGSQPYQQRGFATPGPFGTAYFAGLHIPMNERQPYPSPHSEGTREASVLPITLPNSMSPQLPQDSSPTGSYSPGPHGAAGGGSREPPRNELGQIYCDHEECISNPPVFSRKCEWSKHMDKHTRPYVCLQPGCEKIRGFTYSGGLLRHEREVHRKYGGPKAPRFCPHKDCKRSTGQGFSRKENLHEHLRRVHRGVGITEDDQASMDSNKTDAAPNTSAPPTEPITSLEELGNEGSAKKRKRGPSSHGDDSNQEDGPVTLTELREENKRLKRELADRDQRLKALEDVMFRSMQPQN